VFLHRAKHSGEFDRGSNHRDREREYHGYSDRDGNTNPKREEHSLCPSLRLNGLPRMRVSAVNQEEEMELNERLAECDRQIEEEDDDESKGN
jgi:hypothetical protein